MNPMDAVVATPEMIRKLKRFAKKRYHPYLDKIREKPGDIIPPAIFITKAELQGLIMGHAMDMAADVEKKERLRDWEPFEDETDYLPRTPQANYGDVIVTSDNSIATSIKELLRNTIQSALDIANKI